VEKRYKDIGLICFWTGLVIELLLVIIDKSAYINPFEGKLFRLTFLLFCIKIAATKYSMKEWWCILGVGAVAFLSYLINDKDEVVRAVIFIAACKDVSLRKNMQTVFWVTLAGCAVLILLSVTGIYGNVTVTADFGRGSSGEQLFETRYTLGMGHPNAFHCMIWLLITLALYLYRDAMKIYHYVLVLLVNFGAYFLSNSNTGMLVGFATIFGIMLMHYFQRLQGAKWVYIAGAVVIAGTVIFSAIGSHLGNTVPFMYKLDKMLNGRYQYCYYVEAARIENWKLFAAPENTEFFDAGFVRLFYWYGIIPGILYVFMNFYLIYQGWRSKDYGMLVMIVAFSIYNLMEAHFFSIYILRNYLFVLMGYYWYQPLADRRDFEGYFWEVKALVRKT